MNPLQTARICIIDDEPDEYLHLIHALSRIGLGCIHIDGSRQEDLPQQPYQGLRLVFLDMHLGTVGEAVQVAAQTANAFSRIVAPDGGPALVVFWTKRLDCVDAFKFRLFEKWPDYLGRLVFARMEKPAAKENIDFEKLEEAISVLLKDYKPLHLLWAWEQAVHEAATDTTSALADLAAKRAGVIAGDTETDIKNKIESAYQFLLRVILDASAGRNAEADSALRDLYAGLSPLHNDRLDHNSKNDAGLPADFLLVGKRPIPSSDEALAINSMLLVAPVDNDAKKLCPGSLYTVADLAKFQTFFSQDWNDIAKKFFNEFTTTPKERAEYIAQSRILLAEVSADCDYAQKKRPIARVVTGILIPSKLASAIDEKKQFSPAMYLMRGTAVNLKSPEGSWLPIFISQFVFSLPSSNFPDVLEPLGRLRTGPLAELRHWLATHATRPGYLSIR